MTHLPLEPFGKTSRKVSKLGLGLAALGRPGYINLGHSRDLSGKYAVDSLESHSHTMLDYAWQSGIRYFDTARSYGRGEEFLGSWLSDRQMSSDDLTIGSKWGYTYTANWQVKAEKHEVKEHTLPVLLQQWNESQQALGEFLGIYHIHSATLDSGVLEREEVLDQLATYRNQGIYIGLSLSGAGQANTLEKALNIQRDGLPLFSSVQATWNLLEQSAGPLLQDAHSSGMGVIIKEALANGRLTSRNTNPDFKPVFSLLEREAEILESSPEALALAAVMMQPWVDVVLSGAASVDHLRDNLTAYEIPPEQISESVLSALVESPEVYWSTRSQLAWN